LPDFVLYCTFVIPAKASAPNALNFACLYEHRCCCVIKARRLTIYLSETCMIGIVIVSHSPQLAAGVRELALQMVHEHVPIALAAGIDDPADPIGTDPLRVAAAIQSVYSADGVLVLMDLGSALLSAETAFEF
jgi:hypothetical protein